MSPEPLNPQRFGSHYCRRNCEPDRGAPGMAILYEAGWPVHPLRWSLIYSFPGSDQPRGRFTVYFVAHLCPLCRGVNVQKNLSTSGLSASPRHFWNRYNRVGAGRIRVGQPLASCWTTFPELVILGVTIWVDSSGIIDSHSSSSLRMSVINSRARSLGTRSSTHSISCSLELCEVSGPTISHIHAGARMNVSRGRG